MSKRSLLLIVGSLLLLLAGIAHELAEGQGFAIYVGDIEGLMLLEGSLKVVRLRFRE